MASASFAVVTPCMNMAPYLPATIESVLANLRPGDEFFVIDGGSTDESAEIVRSYSERLSGWASESDRGYADALAKGFARSSGEFLCWINAGDLLLAGALDAARDALAQTGSDMIFGDDFYIDEDSKVISFSRGYVADLRQAMLYGGWTPLQDACFWRRSLYDRAGGIDPNIKHAADYDLFLRFATAGQATYVPMAFSAFRRHGGQKSISGAAAYQRERRALRARELARAGESSLGARLNVLRHEVGVRWRVHVSQRRWRRDDLRGRPIASLACAQYWPPAG
jgi:glycosyltransferase involved in cell wall biosynthesis